jgi:hypothetical protein
VIRPGPEREGDLVMTSGRRSLRRGLVWVSAIALAVIVFLAGIWFGGHPSNLPSPLRGRLFESRSLVLVNQALNVLTSRYYRPLNRSSLVDEGLAGMVASLDDPYSQYLDPTAYRDRSEERQPRVGGIPAHGLHRAGQARRPGGDVADGHLPRRAHRPPQAQRFHGGLR